MPYSLTYNSDSRIIEVKFQGDVILGEISMIFSEAAQVYKENNSFLFLGDFRDATMKLSTLELHGLPKMLSDIFSLSGIPVHKLKRAIVVAKDLKDYSFLETVNINRGQTIKIFHDYSEAKKWLLK